MREDEIRRMTQMHAIADYLQKVLPAPSTTPPPATSKAPPPPPNTRRLAFGTQTTPEKKEKQTVPPTTTLDFDGGNIRLHAQVKFRRNQ